MKTELLKQTKMKYRFLLIFVSIIFSLVTVSCDKDQDSKKKIGMFVVGDGYSDSGFKQNCKDGLLNALKEIPFDTVFVSSLTHSQEEIDIFAESKCDALFLAGSIASEEFLVAAANNPDIQFVIVDYAYTGLLKNVRSITFNSDEAAFPCGFIAAYWANKSDKENPVVGMFGGMDIPSVNRFIAAYTNGLMYFNNKYAGSVKIEKFYLNSFDNYNLGYRIADSLIDIKSIDVVMPLAGNAGNGTLKAVKENNKWAVGVDVDQYYSLSDVADILLTSCTKSLDTAIYSVAVDYLKNPVISNSKYIGTLSNRGVDIAPYHAFDTDIPDSIKAEVEVIKKGIIDGSIYTGF